MRISVIVAADENDVIGRAGGLPWHFSEDLKRFKRLTTGHVVVAGRKTHDSIVDRLGNPLPGRITVVVTHQTGLPRHSGVIYQPDVGSALDVAQAIEAFAGRDEVFVIGGAEVYAGALPQTERVYLTRVHDKVPGDAAMPSGWLEPFDLYGEEAPDTAGISFETYERR